MNTISIELPPTPQPSPQPSPKQELAALIGDATKFDEHEQFNPDVPIF